MATTVTWSGGSNLWFTALNWSNFQVPAAGQDVLISGAAVTIDSTTLAAAADITLTNAATLDVKTALALTGTLTGGTLDLSGTLTGGTLEDTFLNIYAGTGSGTLDDVTPAGTMAGLPIGFIAIDPATAASLGPTISVYGTLTLEPGLFDNVTFAGTGQESLAGASGPVTLGAGAIVQGLLGLSGDLINDGQIGDGASQDALTISGVSFANHGTLDLVRTTVSASGSVGTQVYHWYVSTGPTVDIHAPLDNAGLIELVGGTLALSGPTVSNEGGILLAASTTQALVSSGTIANVITEALPTEVDVAASVTSFVNTGTIGADLIDFAGPVSLGALGAISGALQFDGTLDLGGGTLDASAYGNVLIDGLVENGTLKAGTGTLTLSGATLDGVTMQPGGSIAVTGTVALVGLPLGAHQVTLGTVTTELELTAGTSLSGDSIVAAAADTLALPGGTVTLDAASTLTLSGTTLDVTGPGTLEDDGSITVAAGTLAASAAIDGSGTIAVAAGATLTDSTLLGGDLAITLGSSAFLGAATLGDGASVTVGAGATLVVGTLDGNAVVTVDAGAHVTIEAMGGAPTIAFADAPALVVLPGTGALPVTLQNLAAHDLIDFASVSSIPSEGFGAGGAGEAGDALDVTGASGDTARVGVGDQSSYLDFNTDTDGNGGTLVTATACFCTGTRIATARGAVPVERLRRGDLIRTASGRPAPAIWVGRRRVDCRRHARPEDVWPVRIAAHAFAPGRPARALFVSPDHAVWHGGVLIPVRYLLNGATIAQRPAARVEYWHVELPAHGLLLAENLPTESYLDTGNRAAFERTPRRAALSPAAALLIWRARACAPLRTDGPHVTALHARLLARAGTLGHALTEAPGVRIVADGREAVALDTLRFGLPHGTERIRLLSRSFVPAHLGGHGHDPRRLGIAVGRVLLDGAPLRLDDARLGAGWHVPEPGWRWTAGDAVIAAAGAREVAIEVAITGRYWRG